MRKFKVAGFLLIYLFMSLSVFWIFFGCYNQMNLWILILKVALSTPVSLESFAGPPVKVLQASI